MKFVLLAVVLTYLTYIAIDHQFKDDPLIFWTTLGSNAFLWLTLVCFWFYPLAALIALGLFFAVGVLIWSAVVS